MRETTMRASRTVMGLAALIAVLALVAAASGLFWGEEDDTFTFTTIYGEEAEMYGRGLYHYDTVFKGAGFRGTDVVTLVLGIPILILSLRLYAKGSLRGGLLLTGTLAYFLYVYASVALGAAYNDLFLVYIILFSASLFTFGLAVMSFDLQALPVHFSPQTPHRRIAGFMIASGLVTAVIWLGPLLSALFQNEPPELLDSYTTSVTDVLDLGIITPAALVAGVLMLRRDGLGYLITFALLSIEVSLAPMITAQTIFQLAADVSFTTGEIVGPITGFVVLALLAIWMIVSLLRNVSDSPTSASPEHTTSGA